MVWQVPPDRNSGEFRYGEFRYGEFRDGEFRDEVPATACPKPGPVRYDRGGGTEMAWQVRPTETLASSATTSSATKLATAPDRNSGEFRYDEFRYDEFRDGEFRDDKRVRPMHHGSQIDPPNRFEKVVQEPDWEHLDWDREHLTPAPRRIEYLADSSQSIISENDSPDIPFRYSLNPYRGCAHGCAYCYARPGHEYLGLNAGLDFETKIVVKHDAVRLFRDFLARDGWAVEPITFSGVTDCYQPAERKFQLTRGCLELANACGQPVSIITKNALIVRDLPILRSLAQRGLVHVFISLTTLDAELARVMEPRTSIPAARERAISTLADAGIPVGVMLAPIIPGLNESEIPQLLRAARDAGAAAAAYVLLRLPITVKPVFREWLERTRPLSAEKILQRLRATREGKLNDTQWGQRMTGRGEVARQIQQLFHLFRSQNQLDQPLPSHDCSRFVPPVPGSGQLRLF